jgi:hypothetical protein
MAGQCCEHCESTNEDHDLLIAINTNLKTVLHDVKDLKMSKAGAADLAQQKIEGDKIHDNHEKRISTNERNINIALGAFLAIDFALGVLVVFIELRR